MFLIILLVYFHFTQKGKPYVEHKFVLNRNDSVVDAIISKMSIDEKIGQLFIVNFYQATSNDKKKIDSIIRHFHAGGIMFTQTPLFERLVITNYVDAKSVLPLFIASQGNALNEENCYLPINQIINAVNDTGFAYNYITNYADVLKQQNVNIELSNCLNTSNYNKNEYAFCENEKKAVRQSVYFHKALLNNNIISCVNFEDSLFFNTDTIALDSLCHLQNSKIPLSDFWAMKMPEKVIKSIQQQNCSHNFAQFYKRYYGFEGLVVVPLSNNIKSNDLQSLFDAGAELFICNENPKIYIKTLKNLVETKAIEETEINIRVKRILNAKKWTSPKLKPIKSAEISYCNILNTNNIMLSWNLHKKSLSLVKNSKNILPLFDFITKKTNVVIFGNNKFKEFRKVLKYYTNFVTTTLSRKNKISTRSLKNSDNIIILIDKNSEIDSSAIKKLQKIAKTKKIVVVSFGSDVKPLMFADAVLFAYNEHNFSQSNAAQIIAGSVKPVGNFIPKLQIDSGLIVSYKKINRLKYTIPEVAGFDSYKLHALDSLINYAIEKKATPGAQILAAKNGKVFFYKSYGHHSYRKAIKVQNTDIYDLASITKVAATTVAAMKLYENGLLNMHDSIKYYIDDTINCSIKNHQLIDFFIHKTGMPPDMPILKYIMYTDTATGRYDKYFAEKSDSLHTIKLADEYYLRRDYLDSIVASLYKLEIDTGKKYVYSDINFNIIYDILLKKIDDCSYTQFVDNEIYKPLQLWHIGFLPLERFRKKQIAPTQKDRYWRKQLLHGTVHDESAALYGGVAGNAGLFSNANDIAILFQMLINGGTYGNAKIFDKSTIEYFTTAPENSRRALGFNLKQGAFGHTGFTGCAVWANPKTKLIFVFLSNSIHPRMMNKKLRDMKIRKKAHNIILRSTIK